MRLQSFIINLLLSLFVGVGASVAAATQGISIDPLAVSGTVFGVSFTAQTAAYWFANVGTATGSGLMLMAVQVEFWQDMFAENLFKFGNEFLQYAVSADKYVLGGKVVHIPQAGSVPSVTKNRSSWPVTVVQRADTDVTYALDDFSTDGTHIPEIEKMENSLDKAASVIKDHFGVLLDRIADEILYKWSTSTSGNIVRTTGSLVATSLAPGATGTRKKLLKEDLLQAGKVLDLSKMKGKKIAVVPTAMYYELLEDEDFVKSSNVHVQNAANPAEAEVRMWAGFMIIHRSSTTIYDNTPAPKAVGAATATSDNQAVICYLDSAVERAKGDVKFFETLGDASYQGDIYSALIKGGGRIRRNDAAGVAAIVQTA